MKYYLIAGEASGDMHGANLMEAIMKKDPEAEFRFWGGEKMKAVGGTQIEHYKNTAFMGFWEVITHLKTILGFLKKCKKDIIQWNPDVLILIDYPGFNMRIAEFAKPKGFKVVYYISPQIWAWKEKRVLKIKKYVDKMLVILPFEKDFYSKWDYEVDFVGHPLLDEIKKQENVKSDIQISNDKPIIAVLPGSRKQEISKILPEYLKLTHQFSNYRFVVAGLSHIGKDFYSEIIKNSGAEIVFDNTYHLLKNSHAALVASGTATLETALFNVPMVVGYKGSYLSYIIGRMVVKIKYIALVNLIMDEKVVDELIQNDLNEINLCSSLQKILNTEARLQMLSSYEKLRTKLGGTGASERAAEVIHRFLSPSN
jgi:lipid-A-disaccharide synthase